jgi:hypothetical protein
VILSLLVVLLVMLVGIVTESVTADPGPSPVILELARRWSVPLLVVTMLLLVTGTVWQYLVEHPAPAGPSESLEERLKTLGKTLLAAARLQEEVTAELEARRATAARGQVEALVGVGQLRRYSLATPNGPGRELSQTCRPRDIRSDAFGGGRSDQLA